MSWFNRLQGLKVTPSYKEASWSNASMVTAPNGHIFLKNQKSRWRHSQWLQQLYFWVVVYINNSWRWIDARKLVYYSFSLKHSSKLSNFQFILSFINSCESWLCDRNRTSSSSNSWDRLEGKWGIFLSGIGLSVSHWNTWVVVLELALQNSCLCGFRVSLENSCCMVVRVSHKTLV